MMVGRGSCSLWFYVYIRKTGIHFSTTLVSGNNTASTLPFGELLLEWIFFRVTA